MVADMSVPMVLLGLLESHPTHGFALKRRYDALLGADRQLKYGQVYSTLTRLERDGYASEVGIEPGSGGDRRLYAITDAGVAELDTWLATPHLPADRPTDLVTKVVLALAVGRPAAAILDGQRRVYLDRMRELTAARREADPLGRALADYEIAHLEADLRWIELAGTRLAGLAAQLAPEPGDD